MCPMPRAVDAACLMPISAGAKSGLRHEECGGRQSVQRMVLMVTSEIVIIVL